MAAAVQTPVSVSMPAAGVVARPCARIAVACVRKFAALVLAAASLAPWAACAADVPTLVVSTQNTPSDRRVLEEVSREAFRRIGHDIRVVSLPSERSLRAADSGEVDGEGLRIAGLEQQYPRLVMVPEGYTTIGFMAFARKEARIALPQGWESLRSHHVAFITGWKLYEANTSGARSVTRVREPEQLFRMLDDGRVDVALYTRADGLALVRRIGLQSIVQIEPSLREADMHLYLNRKHEALVPRIAQALREMKADGTHGRIRAAIVHD